MQAVYYRAADGSEPVDAFIEALRDPDRQGALDNQIERLNMLRPNDPPLPFPWSSQLEGELRELRCHYGSEHYRVLYRRSGNLFLEPIRKPLGKRGQAHFAPKTAQNEPVPDRFVRTALTLMRDNGRLGRRSSRRNGRSSRFRHPPRRHGR